MSAEKTNEKEFAEKSKTKKVRETRAEMKRESKRKYFDRKKAVAEKEAENFRYLYIFKTHQEDWWKMGWNSVLFFRYIVAKRVGRKVKVNNDQDFGVKSPTGIVSLRGDGLPALEKAMHELGYRLDRGKSWPGVKVIDLGYTVSKEDVKRYEHEEEAKLERLNSLVPVVIDMPELDTKLYEIAHLLYIALNRMPEPDRVVIGYEMQKEAITMMKAYRYMAWGNLTPEKGLKKIREYLTSLRTAVNVAARIEYLDKDMASRLGVAIVEAERLLKARLGEKTDSAGAVIRKNRA